MIDGGTIGKTTRRAARDGLSVVGAVVLILLLANPDAHGLDARGYWSFDPANPYREAFGNLNALTAFRYAPPIALAFMPLQVLPWVPWITLWTLVQFAALLFLTRRWALAALAFYPVAMEVSAGNVNLLIGVAVVAGFRWPAAWSFVLLTKISPGVGLVSFAVRREWRPLVIAAAATFLACVLAAVVRPELFAQWFEMLRADVGLEPDGLHVPVPLWVRVVGAATLVAWGARTNRRWTVLVGATLALPTIWTAGTSMLVGLVALARERGPAKPSGTGPSPVDGQGAASSRAR